MELKSVMFMFCLKIILCFVDGAPNEARVRPPPLRNKLGNEKETNFTIDQLITQTLGGVNVAAQKMRSPGDGILAELDMVLTQEQFIALYEPPSSDIIVGPEYVQEIRKKRKAVKDTNLKWTNNEVPYKFSSGHFDDRERYMMKQAMTEWERYTCLRFRKSSSRDDNVLQFQNGEGCSSQLGMVGGIQVLNLEEPGCRYKGLYLHEIGHAIGLVHEHQLPERDDYIKILYNNVEPQMRIWFNKYSPAKVNTDNIPYEYSSVMHYGVKAFSKDGTSKTMEAKFPAREEEIGRIYLKELAFTDVKAVNLMYSCGAFCPKTVVCTDGGFVDQNCKCICPDGTSDCQVTKDTIRETQDSCVNLYDDWPCTIWANFGECERNAPYMNRNCKKACRLCGIEYQRNEENHFTTWAWQWLGMFADVIPQDWKIGVCKDVFPSDKCLSWKENGDCVTNTGWMKRNCKGTCNYCDATDNAIKPEVNCNNTHPNEEECDKWALEAECNINKKWMYENCRKACRICDTEYSPDTDEDNDGDSDGECRDKHNTAECAGWAASGECAVNSIWMVPNCRKSCGKCKDGECKNMYDSVQCDIWAEENECNKNPTWMKDNCAKSCRECIDRKTTRPGSITTTTTKSSSVDNGNTDAKTTTTESSVDNGNTDANCRNSHNDVECKIWADSDHCEINPEWMLNNCQRSCNQCSGSEDGGDTDNGDDDDDKLKPSVDCFDKNSECAGWAKFGYCETNPRYNLIYCKYSCKNCNGCRDEHILCDVWQKGGLCIQNARYMLRHCQKSCKVCEH